MGVAWDSSHLDRKGGDRSAKEMYLGTDQAKIPLEKVPRLDADSLTLEAKAPLVRCASK